MAESTVADKKKWKQLGGGNKELPEGFVVDNAAQHGSDLPEGFSLDNQQSAPDVPQGTSIMDKAKGLLTALAGGLNRGAADMLGLPVDAARAMKGQEGVLGPAGLPLQAINALEGNRTTPVMGSSWIKDKLMPGAAYKPEGMAQNILAGIGEQVPAMLTGGAATEANLGKAALMRILKPALGAGVASGVARTVAPDSPALDMAAQVLGSAGPSAVKGLTKMMPNVERSMYERAGKFSTTLKDAERARRIETGLNEGIATTKGGLKKSQQVVADINNEIQGRIDKYAEEGATVNTRDIADRAEGKMLEQIIGKEPLPDKPLQQVGDVTSEFREYNPKDISLRTAQNYKQSLNKQLDDFYAALKTSPDKTAVIQSQWTNKTKAALADELRGEISSIFPEVSGLNKREGALIQLNKSVERAVNRIGQRDLLSLKGVASLTHPKLFFTQYVLNNPAVQSNLAIAIRKARNAPVNKAAVLGTGLRQAANAMRSNEPEQ